MPTIEVHRRHGKSKAEARSAVDRVAKKLSEKFDVRCDWRGDTLCFRRPGVDGEIALEGDEVQISANLGLLLLPLKGPIEAEIHRYLDKEFDAQA